MMTFDKPDLVDTLEYRNVAYDDLQQNASWVQSSGLAAKGMYLFPSVITTDGGAKGTYDNAVAMIQSLQAHKSLLSRYDFSRSFAPTTSKINQNGKASLAEPPGTLFEAACSAIATLTHLKAAAWMGQKNTAIYPDLPLNEQNDALWQFVRLFEEMVSSETSGLMLCKLPSKPTSSTTTTTKAKNSKKTESAAPKSEYRRPKLHHGNYPTLPNGKMKCLARRACSAQSGGGRIINNKSNGVGAYLRCLPTRRFTSSVTTPYRRHSTRITLFAWRKKIDCLTSFTRLPRHAAIHGNGGRPPQLGNTGAQTIRSVRWSFSAILQRACLS